MFTLIAIKAWKLKKSLRDNEVNNRVREGFLKV